jgi:hypothetical protein
MSTRTPATATPPSAGRAATAPPRHYDEAFQRHAVELWQRGDKPGTQIARELGIRYDRLKAWNAATTAPSSRSAPNWRPKTAPSKPNWRACASSVTF